MVAAASMFGTLGYMSRMANALGLGPAPFVFWRALIGTAALLAVGVFVRTGGIGSFSRVPQRRRLALIFAATLGAVLNLAMFVAFQRMAIAVALTCFYTFPALVTIASVPLYGERLEPRRVAALVLSSGGLLLVLLAPLLVGSTGLAVDPLGVGLALFGAVCQASFVLIAGRGFKPLGSLGVSTVVVVAAMVISALVMVLVGDSGAFTLPLAESNLWPWVLFGGITGAAIPTVFFISGIARIGPARAAILMTFEPLVGVTLAALLLGERPVALQLVGGAAVLAAAAILQTTGRRVPTARAGAPVV